MSRCASCQAEIEWVRTTLGRPMPLDPPRVRVVANRDGQTVIITDAGRAIRGDRVETGGEEGRESHFATCPGAGQHRRS